jgi:hypothetical protein
MVESCGKIGLLPDKDTMGFGFLVVALLGSAWTTLIGIAGIAAGVDEGPHVLAYFGAVAALCAVIATAIAFSRGFKRAADVAFLTAGALAFAALTAFAILLGRDVRDVDGVALPIEAYIKALGGPVLMVLPGALSIHARLNERKKQGQTTRDSVEHQDD